MALLISNLLDSKSKNSRGVLNRSSFYISRTADPEVEDTEGSVKRTYSTHQWQVIRGACSPVYIPTADDKGLKLRVQCTPARYDVKLLCDPLNSTASKKRHRQLFTVRCPW